MTRYDVSKAVEVSFDVFDKGLDPEDVMMTVRLAAQRAAEASCGYSLDDSEYTVRRLYASPTDPDGMSGTYHVEVRWWVNRTTGQTWEGEVSVRQS